MANKIVVEFDADDLHESLQAAAEEMGMEFVELTDAFKAKMISDIKASVMDDEDWSYQAIANDVYFDFIKRDDS